MLDTCDRKIIVISGFLEKAFPLQRQSAIQSFQVFLETSQGNCFICGGNIATDEDVSDINILKNAPILCNWRYSTSLYWTHSLDGNICAAVPQFNRKGKLQRLIFTDQDIRQHLVASLPPPLMSKGLLTMCCGKPASCSILL